MTTENNALQWLQKWQPDLYRVAKKKLPAAALAGLGIAPGEPTLTSITLDTSLVSAPTVSTAPSWSDTLKDVVTAASSAYLTKTQLDAQKKILDLQIQRQRAGLPPADIDPSSYGVPQVRLGLSTDTKTLLMWGAGLAGGGLLLYLIMSGGRRRHR